MQATVERDQGRADRRGEDDQQQCDRHDHFGVLQPDRGHQQESKTPLRAEHLAQNGADQRQGNSDPNAVKISGRHAGSTIERTVSAWLNRITRAVFNRTDGTLRQPLIVKIAIGTIPWIAPKATLAGMPDAEDQQHDRIQRDLRH